MKRIGKLLALLLALVAIVSVVTIVVHGANEATPLPAGLSKETVINSSLVMKVNSGNSLLRGVKTALNAEPYKENGKVMIPLDALTGFTGKDPAGSYTSQTKGGVTYIAMDDVESAFSGYYVTYDESGMIFIADSYDEFLNRNNDELLIQKTAKRFIFTDTEYFHNFEGMVTFSKTLSPIDSYDFTDFVNLVAGGTDSFTHPYILADQEKFDELNRAYLAKESDSDYDPELAWYIQTQIEYADSYLNKYANLDGNNYVGLKLGHWTYNSQGMASWDTTEAEGNHSVSRMPYTEGYASNTDKGYGYDPAGGRLNVLSDGESCLVAALEPCALAYQITHDEKYLEFAYDWMTALCAWEHWGPGHFLNCANTARPLATAYDWLYNGFVDKKLDVDYIAERIYENAVYEATVTLTNKEPEHPRVTGNSSTYWRHIGNWNSCGTLGMLIASLAVMEHEEYRQDAAYVIAASLGNYMERGMTYISLDGGYRESAGYWGCVRFMHFTTKILMDTMGTDFGLLDYPGMDTTDYFGCHTEGSDYDRWNYHDDWNGTQGSYWYYLSADLYDNPEYAAIRYNHIHSGDSGKAPHRYDLLFYDKELVDSVKDNSTNLALDNVMTSIDATLSRSSWESGALYAGIMGGRNNVAHGQYDSGNWIYENGGIRWFVDLGADDYNLAGGGFKYGYYKYSAEGNNTLALGSLPHGQRVNDEYDEDGSFPTDGGEIISAIVNEYGSATVIDQSGAYNGVYRDNCVDANGKLIADMQSAVNKVEYAYRGMLVTNSRSTVVIQDQVKTLEAEDLYWFAHYSTSTVMKVTLSDDGKTAYMMAINSDGEFQKLRVTLVSDNEDLKFEIMDTYTYFLDTPNGTDPKYASIWATNTQKGTLEHNRNNFRKLAVKAEGVRELNMAVVIELIDSDDEEVGYTYMPMNEWVPEIDENAGEGGEGDNRPKYTVYYNDGTREDFYTTKLSEGLLVDPTVTNPQVKSNITRVECHTVVVADKSFNMVKDHNLVIDLGGNMIAQKSTFRVGASARDTIQHGSLTVNNGEWACLSASGFQVRYGASLIMNNVTYTSTGYLVRDEGGKFVFNNCDLASTTHFINVNIVGAMTENDEHYIILNNSRVNVGTAFYKYETAGLSVSYGNRLVNFYQILDVYLLDNTTLRIGGDMVTFATATGAASPTYIPGVYSFYVEDGVKLYSEGIILPESGSYVNANGTETELIFNVDYRTNMSYRDGVIDLGDDLYRGDEKVVFAPVDKDIYKYEIAASGIEALPYVINRIKFENPYFIAYKSNGEKIAFYTDSISDALPTGSDNGVVRIQLLKDSRSSSNTVLGDAQALVIDLNGKTLTSTARISIGNSTLTPITASLKIINGKLLTNSGNGFITRLGTTLIFDGVTITAKDHVLWDNGGALIAFNNCTVTSNNKIIYARYGNEISKLNGKREMVFNNTKVTAAKNLVFYSEMTISNEFRNFFVLGSSQLHFLAPIGLDTAHPANINGGEFNVYITPGAYMPYADFGFGEDTETVDYNVFGCQKVVLNDGFAVDSYAKFVNCKVVEKGGYYTVEIVSMVKGVKSSLTLYSDFTLNFFIPIEGNVIESVKVLGVEYIIADCEIYTEGGVSYYKVAIKNIAADMAAEDLDIRFCYEGVEEVKNFSVVKYCQIIFSSPNYYETYSLAAAAVNYINASYNYVGREKPAALTSITSSTLYRAFLPDIMAAETTTSDRGNLGVAISTAQLDLGASLNYRFNIKEGFTGTIVINGISYDVEDGLFLERDYLTVSVRAYDMYDLTKYVEISGVSEDGTEFSGTYDIRSYINYYGGGTDKLSRLLDALYTYATSAYEYKYDVKVERPVLGDTPSSGVDFD